MRNHFRSFFQLAIMVFLLLESSSRDLIMGALLLRISILSMEFSQITMLAPLITIITIIV
jgi:hypothetical protein